MKRILALLMAMMLAMTAVSALADGNASWSLSIAVSDAEGAVLSGARVTVRDGNGNLVLSTRSNANGLVKATLSAGTYTVRAMNAENGYSAQQSVSLYEDTDLALTVRTLVPGSEVTVGSVTKVTGQFSTDLFGNNTSDMDVRAMLHGYSTVAFTSDATYAIDDSVVTVETAASDGLGNKMYEFRVKSGLTYNDGTPITAKDYVFSILMQSSPAIAAIGGDTSGYWQVLGYDEFSSGKRNYISGLRLLDDMTFSMNIRTDALPYFYELMLVRVTPYPISVIAPGCDVADDGRGAYIKGAFTAELLRETMLDPETGYCSHPMVTSGPYQLVSYDAESGTVVMKANTNYHGNYEGQRPLIETVTLVETTNAEAVAQLADGTLDIVNKLSDSQVIDAGVAAATAGEMQSSSYLRAGLGFLSFACEQGPTAVDNVRKAISYCLDQDAFVSAFTGIYGRAVYSWYGLGQWMAGYYLDEMEQHATLYPLDLDEAEKLVQRAGFIYNEKGDKFTPGVDTVRYRLLQGNTLNNYNEPENPVVETVKVGNKNLLPLQIKFAKVENNRMCELVEQMLLPNLQAVGFDVVVVEMSFEEMLAQYYRDDVRECNMYALATNFGYVYDPMNTWRDDDEYPGHVNTTGISDGNLFIAARNLRAVEPGDVNTYLKRWLVLMQVYSDKLPAIPLYSNMYYDFCANSVQGYAPNANWSWASAILYTWVDDSVATSTNLVTP